MNRRRWNRALVAAFLTAVAPAADAQKEPKAGPLQFHEVVAVGGATRDEIYSSALAWFSQTFGRTKNEVEQNRRAGMLIGRDAERYVPPFLANACSGWLRYRVMLVAKEGRYYYTIDGFSHVGDQSCQKRSFGILTPDWFSAKIRRTIFDFTLQPPPREAEDMETWLDLKQRATSLAGALSGSLRRKLATAGAKKPDT